MAEAERVDADTIMRRTGAMTIVHKYVLSRRRQGWSPFRCSTWRLLVLYTSR